MDMPMYVYVCTIYLLFIYIFSVSCHYALPFKELPCCVFVSVSGVCPCFLVSIYLNGEDHTQN